MRKIMTLLLLSWICAPVTAQELHQAKKWAGQNEWAEGWDVRPHRHTNWREFADQYRRNRALWRQVFAWLATNDLAAIAPGDHVIEPGRAWATVSEYTPKTAAATNIESHRRFVDLQYVLRGNEKMGLAAEATERTPYNEERDVAFYRADRIRYYRTSPGRFFLFFPSDIHQPSARDGKEKTSRKIVIKIEYIPADHPTEA